MPITQSIKKTPESASDADLAARAANGDAAAFEAIMRQHNRLLFRTARSIARNDADAEDVLQDAWLRAWRAIDTFRADAKLSTWLVRIVMNEALGRLRRPELPGISLDDAMRSPEPDIQQHLHANADQQPDRIAARAELRQLIEGHIDQLPDGLRSVFMLHGVEELDVDEIAQALAIPPATVRTRFFRARGHLRKGLARDIDVGLADAFSFDGARCDRIVNAVLKAHAAQAPHAAK